MQLTKFLVELVQEEKTIIPSVSFLTGKRKQITMWDYIITSTDNNEYYYSAHSPQGIWKNLELRCFVSRREPHKYSIEYNRLYKNTFLSPLMFKKAKEDYIQKYQEEIQGLEKEIKRLQSL